MKTLNEGKSPSVVALMEFPENVQYPQHMMPNVSAVVAASASSSPAADQAVHLQAPAEVWLSASPKLTESLEWHVWMTLCGSISWVSGAPHCNACAGTNLDSPVCSILPCWC